MQNKRDQLWGTALKLIQIRSMSRHDLKGKLRGKHPGDEALIDDILDEMERVQLLNDRRYAEQLVHHLTMRPVGRLKLTNEARKRGLDLDMFQELLVNIEYDEEAMAKQAYEEKSKSITESDPRKRKQKLMNFLRNRGFTDAVIWSTIRK